MGVYCTYLAKVRRVPRRVVVVREVLRVYELAFREPCVQEPSVISELRVCLLEGEGGGYGATVSGAKVLVDDETAELTCGLFSKGLLYAKFLSTGFAVARTATPTLPPSNASKSTFMAAIDIV